MATTAAATAGVEVRVLTSVDDQTRLADLLSEVWGTDGFVVPRDILRGMASAHGYVSGAFQDGTMVGGAVAFCGPPARSVLHSHVTAVLAASRNHGVALAIKLHQRSWALAAGISRITWTFDPLMAKNAFFNIGRLGVVVGEYLPNHYGAMQDAINGADDSDRLLADWDLTGTRERLPVPGETWAELVGAGATVGLSADHEGRPATGAPGDLVLVQVPAEMAEMRAADPDRARAWRAAVREVLGGLLDDGAEVVGFLREGWYVVDARGDRGGAGHRILRP